MRRLLVVLSTLTAGVLFALPAAPGSAGTGGHAAITINSNADFATCGCVTSGNGTAASPYVIGPWAINAPSNGTSGWSVQVSNTTAYFNIFGISSTYNDTNPGDPTIELVNVHTPTTISGNSAHPTAGNDLGMGIELDSSSNISIDGISYNKGNGTGILIKNSSNVSINNSKLKATCDLCTAPEGDGINATNSSNLNIGNGADCPKSGPCIDVTYDDGFGIYLQNTDTAVIDHATADANDTGGYVLDGSSHVTVENSSAQGDGNICFTVNGGKANSGYHSDLQGGLHLINGASDNTITNDTFANNTSIDVGSGGNGFFYDACLGGVDVPFSTGQAGMGLGNQFSNICYLSSNNVAGLPPSTCKS